MSQRSRLLRIMKKPSSSLTANENLGTTQHNFIVKPTISLLCKKISICELIESCNKEQCLNVTRLLTQSNTPKCLSKISSIQIVINIKPHLGHGTLNNIYNDIHQILQTKTHVNRESQSTRQNTRISNTTNNVVTGTIDKNTQIAFQLLELPKDIIQNTYIILSK